MLDGLVEVLQGVIVIAVILGVLFFHYQRSNSILEQWASVNGFHIINSEYRSLLRGPFFFTTKNQTVYRVTVRDRYGVERTGWVRCGGFFLGLMSDHAEVRWD